MPSTKKLDTAIAFTKCSDIQQTRKRGPAHNKKSPRTVADAGLPFKRTWRALVARKQPCFSLDCRWGEDGLARGE